MNMIEEEMNVFNFNNKNKKNKDTQNISFTFCSIEIKGINGILHKIANWKRKIARINTFWDKYKKIKMNIRIKRAQEGRTIRTITIWAL